MVFNVSLWILIKAKFERLVLGACLNIFVQHFYFVCFSVLSGFLLQFAICACSLLMLIKTKTVC